jgi:nicotinamidase-related amidase
VPLTKLDTNAALIVIDLQKGVVNMPTAHPIGEIVKRSARLARAFRERDLPVVLVNVTDLAPGCTDAGRFNLASFPPDWTELVPELQQQAGDHVVSKQRVGAFIGTGLDDFLRKRGVTQVFVTGVATSAGVESTARNAYDHGYNVVLVTDAMTDRSAEAHRHSVEVTFPRLGETDTTENVLKSLRDAEARQGETPSGGGGARASCPQSAAKMRKLTKPSSAPMAEPASTSLRKCIPRIMRDEAIKKATASRTPVRSG